MCNIEGDVDIDIYDLNKPWINKAVFKFANINNNLEPYISAIEAQIGQTFPRQYNSIILDIIGYVSNPEIKNLQPINIQEVKPKSYGGIYYLDKAYASDAQTEIKNIT